MPPSPKAPNGVSVIKWHGAAVTSDVAEDVARRLTSAAILVTNRAKSEMAKPKTGAAKGAGRWKGFITRRSAPGEAPASQTGALYDSIVHDAPTPLRRRVGTNLKYGKYLELGTKDIAARPWLEVSLFAVVNKIRRLFRGGVRLSQR